MRTDEESLQDNSVVIKYGTNNDVEDLAKQTADLSDNQVHVQSTQLSSRAHSTMNKSTMRKRANGSIGVENGEMEA